jgi:hypothetical protein
MGMEAVGRRRFRVSVRSLMIAVAVIALALVPFLWVARQTALVRAQALRALAAERMARAEAERSRYVAQVHAAQAQLGVEAAAPLARPEAGSTAGDRGGLWAALAVNHAAFRRGEAQGLYVEFTLVNDGEAAVDPKVGESRIVVDGAELADSGLILGNGPRDARFAALPPGGHLRFGYALGDHFRQPGVHRVSWRGAGFRSPEVVIRVLPDEAK